jgi:hypothetical protein
VLFAIVVSPRPRVRIRVSGVQRRPLSPVRQVDEMAGKIFIISILI